MTTTTNRFHIAEIEDTEGNIIEWIVSDSQNEYDDTSFDSEEAAREELETLMEGVR